MRKLFLFLIIYILKTWSEKVQSFRYLSSNRNKNAIKNRHSDISNNGINDYSFLMENKEEYNREEKHHKHSKKHKHNHENSNEKGKAEESEEEKKPEVSVEENKSKSNEEKKSEANEEEKKSEANEEEKKSKSNEEEKKSEANEEEKKSESNEEEKKSEASEEEKKPEVSAEEKNSDDANSKKNDNIPIEKKLTKENLLEYGSHDKFGNFIPSYKTLTDGIISTNNSLERASTFLKIACSHIMKTIEYIPESKLSTQYIKVDSKNIYIKDIIGECQSIYFALNRLTMTIIVLNSKINKFIYKS